MLETPALYKLSKIYFFLVLDDGKSLLTHLLPAGFRSDCFLVFAFALGCRLIVEQSSSRTTKPLIQTDKEGEEVSESSLSLLV